MTQPEFDVVTDFSVQLPLDVISELLGIPEEYRATIHEMSNRVASRENMDDPERGGRGRAARTSS